MRNMCYTAAIIVFKAVMRFFYFFIKCFPTTEKIAFFSRQSNNVREDFLMIGELLSKRCPHIQCVYLCRKLDGLSSLPGYLLHLFRCMYHTATSKVCVTDTYSIPLSILHHKKSLTIIQIWHALGAIKKFGYQTLNREGGRNEKIAQLMEMHRNYDYVLCASEATKQLYAEAFDISPDRIIITGIPRIDAILEANTEENRNELYRSYHALLKKRIILYVPTFRTSGIPDLDVISKTIDPQAFELVVKLHPLDAAKLKKQGKNFDPYPELSTLQMMTVADYIITDYSAISIEASLLQKPIFFYLYDLDAYLKERGLNFNPLIELPQFASRDFSEIYRKIKAETYDFSTLEAFCNRFVETRDCLLYTSRCV